MPKNATGPIPSPPLGNPPQLCSGARGAQPGGPGSVASPDRRAASPSVYCLIDFLASLRMILVADLCPAMFPRTGFAPLIHTYRPGQTGQLQTHPHPGNSLAQELVGVPPG